MSLWKISLVGDMKWDESLQTAFIRDAKCKVDSLGIKRVNSQRRSTRIETYAWS